MMIDVKTLCLGVLSRGDASGYEIRKEFEEGPLSHFSDAGFGSIYPALKRLLDDGQIAMLPHSGDGRADKKLYRITPTGRQVLHQALMRTPSPDKLRSDLMFMLSFGDQLPARQMDKIIADRIHDYRNLVASLEHKGSVRHTPGERFVEGMGLAIYRAVADYLEMNRADLLASTAREEAA